MQKKKYSIILAILFVMIVASPSFSYVEVKIKPAEKISTSNPDVQEGNFANFIVAENVFYKNKLTIKKGTPVQGLITYVEHNGFGGQNAKITIEQFEVVDVSDRKLKLTGSVFKSGAAHEGFLEFLPLEWARGGEVQIKPSKDSFKLFLKENL